jgi:hypothetical protein
VSRTNPESVIQSAICEYLSAKGVFFTRSNNIPAPIKTFGGRMQFRRLPKHTWSGWPDIVAIKFGHFYGIEVKGPKGKLSPAQEDCALAIRNAGGSYIMVRSIDDLQRAGF